MARLPNTPRPRWAPRSPGPATDAVANRVPLPNRAGAMPTRAPLSERPAKLRPAMGRPTKWVPPIRATPRQSEGAIPKPRAADARHPERAGTAEPCAAPGKAYPPAAPCKPDMPAKAAAMPTKTSATPACIGFKREKRNEEEQHRGHAGAARHLRTPGLIARLERL